MTPTLAERVRAGALLLDERGPADWAWRIDERRLALWSLCQCVLGQLYGDYGRGLVALGLMVGVNHGFIDTVAFDNADTWWREILKWLRSDWEVWRLRRLWLAEIRRRRNGPRPVMFGSATLADIG